MISAGHSGNASGKRLELSLPNGLCKQYLRCWIFLAEVVKGEKLAEGTQRKLGPPGMQREMVLIRAKRWEIRQRNDILMRFNEVVC